MSFSYLIYFCLLSVFTCELNKRDHTHTYNTTDGNSILRLYYIPSVDAFFELIFEIEREREKYIY